MSEQVSPGGGEDALTQERLGENLRRAIKASGLTQTEVAERCEIDQSALSRMLAGKQRIPSLKLALICTATGSDVLGILEAEPLHGPSYRQGIAEAERRVGIPQVDPDGDYTGCGERWPNHGGHFKVCHLPIGHEGPHYAPLYWPRHTPDPSRPSVPNEGRTS